MRIGCGAIAAEAHSPTPDWRSASARTCGSPGSPGCATRWRQSCQGACGVGESAPRLHLKAVTDSAPSAGLRLLQADKWGRAVEMLSYPVVADAIADLTAAPRWNRSSASDHRWRAKAATRGRRDRAVGSRLFRPRHRCGCSHAVPGWFGLYLRCARRRARTGAATARLTAIGTRLSYVALRRRLRIVGAAVRFTVIGGVVGAPFQLHGVRREEGLLRPAVGGTVVAVSVLVLAVSGSAVAAPSRRIPGWDCW
jgi:hypothetical protein